MSVAWYQFRELSLILIYLFILMRFFRPAGSVDFSDGCFRWGGFHVGCSFLGWDGPVSSVRYGILLGAVYDLLIMSIRVMGLM